MVRCTKRFLGRDDRILRPISEAFLSIAPQETGPRREVPGCKKRREDMERGSAETKQEGLANDLLRGADEIAEFLFGTSASGRRKIYYLAECTKIPIFRIGSVLHARRSVLLDWI